jgi:hypothetical protein
LNSKYWCPGRTEAIDALPQNWKSENNRLVTPPSLVSKVINKMVLEKASGTLIVPEWKSVRYSMEIITTNIL